ncbi:MAG: AraC family transcriptional regulator [Cyanobacteria bacterium J06629_19]
MTITLSRSDYDLLWQQANQSLPLSEQAGCAATRSPGYAENISHVPQQLGKGYIQNIQWNGIQLRLFNYQFHDDVLVQEPVPDAVSTCREIGFNLSGNLGDKRTGESFIEWGDDDDDEACTWVTYANAPVLKVDIHLENAEVLCQPIDASLKALPMDVRQSLEDGDGQWLDEVNVITPAMRAALEQMLQCPFQGSTKQMYLESKCLELIALKLEQIQHRTRPAKKACLLNPDDVERIQIARDILLENAQNPPTLVALARQVSLNDYKLKVGFRQVFGTTVFGYLHRYRMEQAHRLLTEQRMNVKEVAQAVGYANQSRFASAFRKQFGLNPKTYLLSKRSV